VERQTVSFKPHLVMKDYADLNTALMAGTGIRDLLPVVQPALLPGGWLVEVMPDWLFRTFPLSLAHLSS
jgi:hypothetical protein